VILDFGYERKSLADLANFLVRNHVDILVDVRANPVYVRKFRKQELESLCKRMGIKYMWIKELGNPFRHFKNWHGRYERYLKTSEVARMKIRELQGLILQGKTICLLCYEKNPDSCHRSLIKREVLRLDPSPF